MKQAFKFIRMQQFYAGTSPPVTGKFVSEVQRMTQMVFFFFFFLLIFDFEKLDQQ